MKTRFFFYILVTTFLIGSFIFGFYIWQETSRPSLTEAEYSKLSEVAPLVFAGDKDFPPLSYKDAEGQYSGYEADLVAALEEYLDIKIEYTQLTWNDALEALSSSEATAITGMRITTERNNKYNFTNPYWETSYTLVYHKDNNHEELLNRDQVVVVLQRDSAAYNLFLDYYYDENISFIQADHHSDALDLIINGKAELWFEKYQVVRHEAHNTGMLDNLSFYTLPESVGQYAIALGPEYSSLIPIFNKALLHLEEDLVLSELDQKWFGLTDYRPDAASFGLTIPVVLYILFSLMLIVIFWNRYLQLKVDQKTEELSNSEKKFKAAFENSHDAIIITNNKGDILGCNQSAIDLFGYEHKHDLLSLNFLEQSPEKQQDGSNSYQLLCEIMNSVHESSNYFKFEWQFTHKNGHIFITEVTLTAYLLAGGTVLQANINDITERKKFQEQLEYLSLHDQLTGIYNRYCFEKELLRLKNSDSYPITLLSCDIDGLKLINDSLGHQFGDKLLVNCATIMQQALRDFDILARVGGDEFCALMPNTDPKTAEEITRKIRANLSAYNKANPNLPLGLSIGLASTENDDTLFNDLYKKADDLMYRDKLYRSTSIKNKLVQSLLAALAEKDNIISGHAQRLEELCLTIGEKVNLTSRQLTDLALLAKVHDLGKVGVTDQILYKPGKLIDSEWTVIKQHSEKGYRIAMSSPDLTGVADLILKHHERWDGDGYPIGLTAEDIPIECRIMAIVDAYDVMINKRPYAKINSKQEALNEIKTMSGSQFDPNLVEVFLSIFNDEAS